MTLQTRIDHLVVAAASLDRGLAWCRDTFGFEPAAGGGHPLMGTHNRVFRIDTPQFPRAYFEIIAIDPAAKDPGRKRWFDLDDPAVRASIEASPRLVHFVASTNDAPAALQALRELGIDRGELLAAERPTPSGLLRWKISVRPDGQRLFDGALPTLIEWGPVHPCDNLPSSGLALQSLEASHPQADRLQAAFDAIGLQQVRLQAGEARLAATLQGATGVVRVTS